MSATYNLDAPGSPWRRIRDYADPMTATSASPAAPDMPARSPEQQALALQIELTAILARGRGVERLLRGWSRRTGESAAVFDRLGNPLARSEGFTTADLDATRDALATEAPRLGQTLSLRFGEAPVVRTVEVTPFAGNDIVRGHLARELSGQAVAGLAAPALRALLALEYERHWLMDEPARRRREQNLARLLSLSEKSAATTLLRGLGIDAPSLRGLRIEARDETHAEVLVDDLAAMFSAPLVGHRGRLVEAMLPGDPLPALGDYGLQTPVGVGTAQPPHHAALSMRQAALALETSRRVGAPIEYRDGAAHDFLLRIAAPDYLTAFADAALGSIERARGGDALLSTLHIWLHEHRSIEATAERMGVHRHTVRNRIQRAAQLTGHDLDSIDTQTELWLALKARGHEYPDDPAAP